MPPSCVVPPRPPVAVRVPGRPPTGLATARPGLVATADMDPGGDDHHLVVVLGPAQGVQGHAVSGPAALGEGNPGPTQQGEGGRVAAALGRPVAPEPSMCAQARNLSGSSSGRPPSVEAALTSSATDEKVAKERMHLDLETDDIEAEVRRLEALGATRYDHQQERGVDFWVLRDPWGNEFCVLHPNFPELLARRRPWTTWCSSWPSSSVHHSSSKPPAQARPSQRRPRQRRDPRAWTHSNNPGRRWGRGRWS
jgi:Glyoxalase-like domain